MRIADNATGDDEMKMGKRRLTCLLAAIMMALFAACGAAQGGAAQSAGSGETQEVTPTAAQEKNGGGCDLVYQRYSLWSGERIWSRMAGVEMRGCESRPAGD